jgi:diaminopimelate decarboxylase
VHSFHYRQGKLHCEGVDLESLAETHGTPLYVYSATTVLDHYRRLDSALRSIDHLICYAVKANSNRAILHLLSEEHSGFDIVSGGELARVVAAGGDPSQCTFAGVGKSDQEIEYALEQGVLSFNVESEAELGHINRIAKGKSQKAPIALRINPDVDAGTHHYVSTGRSENKFGIALDNAMAVYETAAQLPNIAIRGIQIHIGSQITEAAPFVEAIAKITPLILELKERFSLEFFSVGGGIGIVYESSFASGNIDWWSEQGRLQATGTLPLTIEEYTNAILPLLRAIGLRVLLEPGRLLVGNAGILLTRVRYLKQTDQHKFVIVDAGMNDLIRPALYQSYHEIVPVSEPKANSPRETVDVVGPVCESGDFFAQDRQMPAVNENDLLALMSAGAYGFVMASNYNSRLLPAEILVQGKEVSLVRRRQTFDDLVRGERE